jgi:predicted nucleotidyltransferase
MTAIETITEHKKEIKKRYGVKKIGVFGSHVRGEQTETSDVDLLVEFDEPTFDNFMDLLFFLEELFGKDVDLITTRGMSPYIRPNIEKEVVWCE